MEPGAAPPQTKILDMPLLSRTKALVPVARLDRHHRHRLQVEVWIHHYAAGSRRKAQSVCRECRCDCAPVHVDTDTRRHTTEWRQLRTTWLLAQLQKQAHRQHGYINR